MPQDATNRIETSQGATGVWGESDHRDLDAELGRFDRRIVPADLRPLLVAAPPPAGPPEPLAASSSTSTG